MSSVVSRSTKYVTRSINSAAVVPSADTLRSLSAMSDNSFGSPAFFPVGIFVASFVHVNWVHGRGVDLYLNASPACIHRHIGSSEGVGGCENHGDRGISRRSTLLRRQYQITTSVDAHVEKQLIGSYDVFIAPPSVAVTVIASLSGSTNAPSGTVTVTVSVDANRFTPVRLIAMKAAAFKTVSTESGSPLAARTITEIGCVDFPPGKPSFTVSSSVTVPAVKASIAKKAKPVAPSFKWTTSAGRCRR